MRNKVRVKYILENITRMKKQWINFRKMIFTVPFTYGGNKRVQNITLAYEY